MVSNIRHQHRCDPDEVFFRLIDIICNQLETLKSNPNAEPDNENVNRSIVLLGLRLSSGVDVFRIYHADWPNLDAKIIMLLRSTFLVTYHKNHLAARDRIAHLPGFILSKSKLSSDRFFSQ